MPEKIILRDAILSDVKEIAEIYITSRKAYLAFAPLMHSDESVYQWIHEMVATQICTIKVAEKNGCIAGMMVLARKNNIGWIEQLYIAPSEMRHGIGSLLLNLAKQTLGSPIRLHTFQENIQAKYFYEKHGFRIVELGDGSTNEENCPDILYELVSCEHVNFFV